MRSAILLIAVCFVCQAGLASPQQIAVIKLSKPDMDQAAFFTDRGVCLTRANSDRLMSGNNAGIWVRHHMKIFGECMAAKGYKFDSNGTATIRYMQDGRLNVFVEAL